MRYAFYILAIWALLTAAGTATIFTNEDVIVTDDSFTVEELVEDIFVDGSCRTITNIQRIGDARGVGYFEQGAASINMERGIILSTGPISNAHGPNERTDRFGDFNDSSGDPDLNLLSQGNINDAVGIEFDFTPLTSVVTFRYVFASEEYCEYVGSIYNDVFGFFISGPGINGGFTGNAENAALVPGSSDYVSINSINHDQNDDYYIHNERPEDANECFLDIEQGGHLSQIEYDGFTTKLTARLNLIACETYHIRLVIADVEDNFFDSAVFLEAESFNLGGEMQISATSGSSPASAVEEGCPGTSFRFDRAPGSENTEPLTVNYSVVPSSSAQPGIDFDPLPGSITIPANVNSVDVPVNFYNDGLNEATESLTLALDIPCACYKDSATIFVNDNPGFLLSLPDIAICENSTNTLIPTVEGGQAPFIYEWSNGADTETLTVSDDDPNMYTLTVTDECGNVEVATANTTITTAPTALLSGEAQICAGETAYFPLALTGVPPWQISYRIDGVAQSTFEVETAANATLPATQAGLYELTGVEDAGCEGEASGTALLEVESITANIQQEDASCPDASDGWIAVSLSDGTPPFTYFWLDDPTAGLSRENLPPATYTLLVSDAAGCQLEVMVTIEHPDPLQGVELNCEALQSGELKLSASGGTPPYLYAVDGGAFYGPSLFEDLQAGERYVLTIQDANGCELEQDLLMPAAYERVAELPENLQLKLGLDYQLEASLNIPLELVTNIAWSPAIGLSCTDCLNPTLQATQSQLYTLTVEDVFGCVGTVQVLVEVDNSVDVYFPNIFSPNDDRVNDLFTVYANERQVEEVLDFVVYNRWGGLMYQRKNFAPNQERAGWDGTFLGQPMDPGIYTYAVRLLLRSGAQRTYTGDLLLIR
jgi:gliding motility-associated-like protein